MFHVLPRDIVGEKCVGGHGQQAEKQMYMAVLPACVLCGSCMFGVYKARRESSRTGAAGCSCGISRNQTQAFTDQKMRSGIFASRKRSRDPQLHAAAHVQPHQKPFKLSLASGFLAI
ncbi:uncharacterized protein LOC127697741 isoform X5 [Apodemus sylvaticus]|uniref:uncharacterized protein LOC127697741 isoform X5 n=1 Tax=Apodemus sylvaticus TaxID=10129 RepID=UPI002242CEA5|nr:uncharacterized protein LOC127697741 isoform X5 [Apodemus sylvaticus]